MRSPVLVLAAYAVGTCTVATVAAWQPTAAPAAKGGAPRGALAVEAVRAEFESILDGASDPGSFGASLARADAVFDRLVAYGDVKADAASFRLAVQWVRVLHQLEGVAAERRASVIGVLRARATLAGALARTLEPGSDRAAKTYEIVDRLGRERARTLDRFGELAAAVAVVHDAPPSFERAKASDPLAVYDYFVANDGRATLAPSALPAELLVYVVDTPAAPAELAWALDTFPGDRRPGRHFFDVDYDTDNFRHNKPLKLDAHDFTLQNIRKVGGVCRHQAYFASQVGKALGIPSVIDTARGAGTGHAWVGYLDTSVKPPRWNFDDGRYKEYQGLKGTVSDPQTRRAVPDSTVSLTAQFLVEPAENRMLSAALVDGAARLAEVAGEAPKTKAPGAARRRTGGASYPPAPDPAGGDASSARRPDVAVRLSLLEDAVRSSPASPEAWGAVAEMAAAGRLDRAQVAHWSEAALRFCGTAYPDFALDVITPMIESEKDPAERDRLWEWAYDKFVRGVSDARRRRVDLAAMIRFEQAEQWEKAGQPGKAWDRYKQVINEFANDGPFVVTAAERCAAMLKQNSKPVGDRVALYQDAWRKIRKPGEMSREFARQSNWYRVGTAYEKVLREAGKDSDADSVKAALTGNR